MNGGFMMKKKWIAFLLMSILGVVYLTGCGGEESPVQTSEANASVEDSVEPKASDKTEEKTIKIGATPSPHAEILEQAAPILKEKGYTLDIIEFVDYVQPNLALDSSDLDANYFQHLPYLEQFNIERGTTLVAAASIHYEPFGIYPGKADSIEGLADGAQIAVPNDATNEARALLLLEAQGLITLKEDAGLNATIRDIEKNPKNLKIIEIEAAQVVKSLQDVDLAVVNGNYALEAGLKVSEDALAIEDTESIGATTYANVIAVRQGDEQSEAIQALIEALKSDEVRQFIEENYEGGVVPLF